MSEPCGSISGSPFVIHSATVFAIPGASLIQTAATDQRFFTSGVSPMIGLPSGVRDSRPLIASFTPARSSPTISGNSSSESSSCGSKSSFVNGSIVGERADAAIEGMSSASMRIARWAYEPISNPVPCCRSYMFVSMSRMIGKPTSPVVCSNRSTGPMSIIWWTAGVSGIEAPAIFAIRGLQTPQAITTTSASIVPASVWTRRTRPASTSMPVTSTPAATVRAPSSCAFWRMSVPAWSESTTPTAGV